jgi:hypothetical protein
LREVSTHPRQIEITETAAKGHILKNRLGNGLPRMLRKNNSKRQRMKNMRSMGEQALGETHFNTGNNLSVQHIGKRAFAFSFKSFSELDLVHIRLSNHSQLKEVRYEARKIQGWCLSRKEEMILGM